MDTDSRKGLRLLSLDGGGVRGLASLLILKRIMYNLDSKLGPEVERPLLPCNYFDMIAGTSTGGLIAIMLGVLRMDIETCIMKYTTMASRIFPEERFVSGSKLGRLFKGVKGEARFDARNLENVVTEMVFAAFGNGSAPLQIEQPEEGSPQCRTFVCVTNMETSKPFRLRSYRSAWEPGTGCTVWQAARATTAAPLYFDPIKFGEPATTYVDGGLNSNNPVRSLYDEAKHVWGKSSREIKCIISIGTGVPPLRSTGRTGKEILESMVAIATDTQKTADQFADEMEHLAGNASIDYYRLNVSQGLEKMKLEEWKDFDILTGATSYYLNSRKEDLDRCANSLLEADVSRNSQEGYLCLSELPMSRTPFFGRASEIARLRTMLSDTSYETSRQQGAVLWGLGGFGKTRIALEYLKTYQNDYSAIIWVNSATIESVQESFTQAATVLRSRVNFRPRAPLVGARANMHLVHEWLSSSENRNWLMVVDSLDDVESFDCRELVPECNHGNIIVTSVQSQTADVLGFQGLELGGLDPPDGRKMLISGVGVKSESDEEVTIRIVKAMGGVPLAIEQARALIKQGIPVRDFLEHYELQYQKLMSQKPVKSAWDYDKNLSIISVFNLLLSKLDGKEDAQRLLAFVSCFGPRQVAVSLMSQVHQSAESVLYYNLDRTDVWHTHEMTWLTDFKNNRLAFGFAISELESLCLLNSKRDDTGEVVSISLHSLVSRWRLETLTSDMREKWIFAAAFALSKCLPEEYIFDQESQMKLLPLIGHFHDLFRRFVEPRKLEAPEGELSHQYGYLESRFAQLYINSGSTVEGESVFLRAITYRKLLEKSSWPKGRISLLLLQGLAMMLTKNGKMEDAAETTQSLHDVSMKKLGPKDEITTWAAARLPVVRDRKHRYAEDEQRAIIASQGGKRISDRPGVTSDDSLQRRCLREPPSYEIATEIRSTSTLTLAYAASMGDMEGVRRELGRVADANGEAEDLLAAMLEASLRGCVPIVQLLLDHGADVNARGDPYITTLHRASLEGDAAVVDLLLENEADVNGRADIYITALHQASLGGHAAVVDLLLKNGADVNARGDTYITALHKASLGGHAAVVELLLKNGADVNAFDRWEGTALHYVAYCGHIEVVELLLKNGADINACSRLDGTVLGQACRQGHLAVAKLLLRHGAEINALDIVLDTALGLACRGRHIEVVKLLLKNGAETNAGGGVDGNALHQAVFNRHIEVVELLLKHGAEVNALDKWEGTALHQVARYGYIEVARLLLKHGAEVNALDTKHDTALGLACRGGHVEIVKMLLENGAGTSNDAALPQACRSGYVEVVKLLLSHGADINAKSDLNCTALQIATLKGNHNTVQLLLTHGADVNTTGGKYGTALQIALRQEDTELISLLKAAGASQDVE